VQNENGVAEEDTVLHFLPEGETINVILEQKGRL
jgi:hypothetical protein